MKVGAEGRESVAGHGIVLDISMGWLGTAPKVCVCVYVYECERQRECVSVCGC